MNVLYFLGGTLVSCGITALSMGVQPNLAPAPAFAVVLGAAITIITAVMQES